MTAAAEGALLTTADVAALLGVDVVHVRKMIARRDLRAYDVGLGAAHVYRVRRVDLDALLDARTTIPPAPPIRSNGRPRRPRQ